MSSQILIQDISRSCDHQNCLACNSIIRAVEDGMVMIVPTKALSKLKKSTLSKFKIQWDLKKKRDFFHLACWNKLRGNVMSVEERIIQSIEEYKEIYSSLSTMKQEVAKVVDLLMQSKRTVCFTGAGISASAGIPTYRGTDGVDTMAALSNNQLATVNEEEAEEEEGKDVDYKLLQPTFAHKALVKMYEMGKLEYCITQNCDNLHEKAGLSRMNISDLHGNVFTEYCEKCFTEYVNEEEVDIFSTDCYNEPYYKKCPTCRYNHYTGRICSHGDCKGKLLDKIVNFGDDLHNTVCGGMLKASTKSKDADVCLCMGSSLCVSPANTLPLKAKKLIIVNLQETDLDEDADIRIWGKCDDFFRLLMPELKKAVKQREECASSEKRIMKTKRDANEEVEEEDTLPVITVNRKKSRETTMIDLSDY